MNTPELTVRSGRPGDADTIIGFNRDMAVETEGRAPALDVLSTGVRAVLNDAERGLYFVVESGGRVVGQMMVTREWSDWRNGWFWWIQSVYVTPEFRQHGVYRRLHEHVEREARAKAGVCGLRLYVEHENERAQRVYVRLGMTRTTYQMFETDWSGSFGG